MDQAQEQESSAQYDAIGTRYEESKTTAAFSAADTFTLLDALAELGGVENRRVLDVACGYGHNSRLLAQAGAQKVVGVDISPQMVHLAREKEISDPLGIEYHVADAAHLPDLGVFDLATAVYLFNYAPSRFVLAAMFRAIRARLGPSGRLLAIVPNPAPFPERNWEPFGSRIIERRPGREAPQLRVEFLTDPPTPFTYYEWQLTDVEQAAAQAGFTHIHCRPNRTPPPDAQRDESFWRVYRRFPISSLLTCTAP
ncbi:class I SAM-dependent methyltransferase [Streptomyces sp. NPDC021622]|uniref:class I SAM-dependent methyltransferase n=1 Tax=Streptomyces sp. NPDC021622 TaxID=3155013 RepID=UPI0034010FE0